jgi:hypothetical protein
MFVQLFAHHTLVHTLAMRLTIVAAIGLAVYAVVKVLGEAE